MAIVRVVAARPGLASVLAVLAACRPELVIPHLAQIFRKPVGSNLGYTYDRLTRRIEHPEYRVHLEPVAVPAA